MLRLTILGLLCFLLAGCGQTETEITQKRLILDFSKKLVQLIKQNDALAYQRIWVQRKDEFRDVNGRPLLINIPVKEESIQQPAEVKEGFERGLASLTSCLNGNVRDIQVIRVEYLIEHGPVAVQTHFFEFEITLIVKLGDHSCEIFQPACVQSQRGVVIGDYFIVSPITGSNR